LLSLKIIRLSLPLRRVVISLKLLLLLSNKDLNTEKKLKRAYSSLRKASKKLKLAPTAKIKKKNYLVKIIKAEKIKLEEDSINSSNSLG